jgi:23S rRNA (adenine2503-C2)-methyltransferase
MINKQLIGYSLIEIEVLLVDMGFKPIYAKQICLSIYKKQISSFLDIKDIPIDLRRKLDSDFEVINLQPSTIQNSTDGTVKQLYRTAEGNPFESAYMPSDKRNTLCVSTQCGCSMGCSFCYTGTLGLKQNLSTAQILGQVLNATANHPINRIVLMGMGEPLDNFENVLKALEILTSNWGLAFGKANITLSTIGMLPQLENLIKLNLCNIAISMHTPFPDQRRVLMPIENTFPLTEVINMLRKNSLQKPLRLSFEYVVIPGKNDSDQHAIETSRLLANLNCHINVIPLNLKHNRIDSFKRAKDFQRKLQANGLSATIRKSRGQDIDVACGTMIGKMIS